MLEFVTPSLLWLSSLLALPVILHFLHRLRNREIEFSSLTFLRQLQKTQAQSYFAFSIPAAPLALIVHAGSDTRLQRAAVVLPRAGGLAQ
jgi:hypothetical protein